MRMFTRPSPERWSSLTTGMYPDANGPCLARTRHEAGGNGDDFVRNGEPYENDYIVAVAAGE